MECRTMMDCSPLSLDRAEGTETDFPIVGRVVFLPERLGRQTGMHASAGWQE
ncbi:hypothetical protein SAM23877_1356 [Streptomyces ambofaciens ATCC 23877]|uniref:Uncharacterized protein n=1 Tax=Streptomyces ambofaciens (strain ATCC 23877 / 3486 / DSM 40053 / JCM 4204 / NBRC 12836 / NRRL B-2516) TaxID=278992 RepID=A0A0K2AMS8_STRA7|nr:hypothetical protein SAM23877_1356 [Streptomyces ambofaciens ATCC 23877]